MKDRVINQANLAALVKLLKESNIFQIKLI